MVVLVVALEVLGQVADALGEDRDLDFRAAGVALVAGVVLDDFLFLSAVTDILLLRGIG